MQEILQNLLNGIAVGAIYALIALGYTMVYGILKLINFAHGDIFMLGSFVGFYAGNWLVGKGNASFGAAAKFFPTLIPKHIITFGGITTTNYQLIVLVVAVAFMALLQYIIYGTK